ncbi:MAG: DUF1343 domain-containing protein [Fimbriimonadaceae bacterium]|jgi:uncharacterized protein YbbC (DUF1343 family)|nr:DUF1343 domain-containing protein [Fimbriimonadaceae bacterium]
MMVQTGLDQMVKTRFERFMGKSVGLVCHQASVCHNCQLILDHLLPFHYEERLEIKAVFGPQHGIWGHTQDNMIEWEGYRDVRTGLRFLSLYGEWREPTDTMLQGIDELIFDVQDVGARYYTFIWTMANCMKACERLGIPVTVLDRPNPIGGLEIEGPGHDPAFASFVGLYPLPARHGLTVGEVALYLKNHYFPEVELDVVKMAGWQRHMHFADTGLPWAMPSPNMPTPATALVYPGQCLLEGTKLSEGRGTTMPFEMWGAPNLDGWDLAHSLNEIGLPGVIFRPVQFQPTFQKFKGEVCQGCFIHVTQARDFRPVLTTVAILRQVAQDYPAALQWQDPPYEYEAEKLPFDILAGSDWIRLALENSVSLGEIQDRMATDSASLEPLLREVWIY